MKLYNVYVIATDGFNAIRVLADNVTRSEATEIEQSKDGTMDFFVQAYEVGSDRDLECVKDIKKASRKNK